MNPTFWEFAIKIWFSGGLLMIPLFVLAVMVFANCVQLLIYMNRQGLPTIGSQTLASFAQQPNIAPKGYKTILNYVRDTTWTEEALQARFDEVNLTLLSVVDRRIQHLKNLVAAAPLTGLLGTVTGMLVTFAGIAEGSGESIDKVAYGISQALITTQTGLIIALPGLFVLLLVQRRKHKLEAALNKLRSVTLATLTTH